MWLVAERRAQLSRSRSRQNVLSPDDSQTSTTALVREINFDAELDTTPVSQRSDATRHHKNHVHPLTSSNAPALHTSRQQNGGLVGGKRSTRTEAEQLLDRLRAW